MQCIAICNSKGGPGKTTTTVNLAGALAGMGHRVLVLDVDGQGDVSSVFVDHHENVDFTVADLFNDSGTMLQDIVLPTPIEGLSIGVADDRLNEVDTTHNFEADPRSTSLVDALDDARGDYDFVLLDTAGKVHLTNFAAVMAADLVLVPVECSRFAVRNLVTIHREYCSVQQHVNPEIAIRFFLSKVQTRDKTAETTRKSLQAAFGDNQVLSAEIPFGKMFMTAINLGKPITQHSKRSKGSLQTVALAHEIIGTLQGGRHVPAAA